MDSNFNSHSPTNNCRFCGYLADDSNEVELNTPWLSSRDYGVLVSVGALVSGWSLVCPTQHKLNLVDDYRLSSFWIFVDNVVRILTEQYGQISVFEHGAFSDASSTSCGTVHAHLHLVPISFSLVDESIQYDKNLIWQQCKVSEIKDIAGQNEYLFVADRYASQETTGMIHVLDLGVSQFFRKVIANKLGIPNQYNYRTNPMLEAAAEAVTQLRAKTQSFISSELAA